MYDRIASHDGVSLIIPHCGIAGSNPAPATNFESLKSQAVLGGSRETKEREWFPVFNRPSSLNFGSKQSSNFTSSARSVSGLKPGKSAGNGTDKEP